jgi:Domain of unknown function (DUF4384)
MSALLLLLLSVIGSQSPSPPNVRFYWGAQVATGPVSAPRYAPLTADVVSLKTGDRVQLYLSLAQAGYVYVLDSSSDGELTRLLPAGDDASVKAGAQHYLPSRGSWFTLDGPPGRELIFVLVSAERLTGLETHLRAAASETADARRARGAAALQEIARLRRLHDQPESAPSRPATLAGKFRAAVPDLAATATEIRASHVYAHTYILEHK